jgi:hypothetical protein
VKVVVIAAVFELIPNPPADLKPAIGGDGNVASVEEGMKIAPQEQAVARIVRPALAVRLDVRGFQHR